MEKTLVQQGLKLTHHNSEKIKHLQRNFYFCFLSGKMFCVFSVPGMLMENSIWAMLRKCRLQGSITVMFSSSFDICLFADINTEDILSNEINVAEKWGEPRALSLSVFNPFN